MRSNVDQNNNGFHSVLYFFAVQAQVIPILLDGVRDGNLKGKAGYRPSDVCCSAPTGSGKTLAFVLPIVQVRKIFYFEFEIFVKSKQFLLPLRDVCGIFRH